VAPARGDVDDVVLAADKARSELVTGTSGFLRGMLAELPRKTCWSIAEHAGEASLNAMQHLLNRAVWDNERVASDLRGFVTDHLGEPDAVLVDGARCPPRPGAAARRPGPGGGTPGSRHPRDLRGVRRIRLVEGW
jgi:hypothetical protein